jgi:long-chain acyl-CoA synthetase
MDTLVDLLSDAAQEFGEATALAITTSSRQERWSYRQLWDFSGRLASLLRERGLSKGDRTIIWSPNRPEWAVAYFGCLRAGAMAVPLDVRSSPDFVARIIERTQPGVAFCSSETVDGLPGTILPVISLDDLRDVLEKDATQWTEPSVGGEGIAQIMFTSGTTGDPKGVILTHRNVVSNILACRELVPVSSSSRLLSLLPLSHMFEQIGGLLVPLSRGATIIYPNSLQPRTLFNTMQSDQVTNLVLVPQALQLLMNGIEREVRAKGKEKQWRFLMRVAPIMPMGVRRWLFREVHRQFGGNLTYIMSGGAYLDPELARKWYAIGIPILQGYGATEASPVITTNTFQHSRIGSVGKVLPGQEIRIADDGEILTRGPNVTQGYWQSPEATAAAFEDGWYRTGDLGYVDQDGFLFLKGRKKDLIVLANGQNVYPEDIESILNKQPGVRDSVVVGLPADGGLVRVHAVLLMEDEAKAAEVVSAANKLLADHQRVRGFTIWPEEDFPRTHTLKVRKNLVMESLRSMPQSNRPE